MRKTMRSSRFWIIVFICIIMLSTASMFFMRQHYSGSVAVIIQDNVEIKRIDLKAVTEPYSFRVDSPTGGYNIVHVEPGSICVTEATCPDKICMHQGMISDSSRPIVCLPHRLMIIIESDEVPAADVISG